MADIFETIEQRRDNYLQIMQKAEQLNDQTLVKLIVKKLAALGKTAPDLNTSGRCIIIPFPAARQPVRVNEYRPTWWTIFRLTLAIPGRLTALFLLAHFRWGPGVYWP